MLQGNYKLSRRDKEMRSGQRKTCHIWYEFHFKEEEIKKIKQTFSDAGLIQERELSGGKIATRSKMNKRGGNGNVDKWGHKEGEKFVVWKSCLILTHVVKVNNSRYIISPVLHMPDGSSQRKNRSW